MTIREEIAEQLDSLSDAGLEQVAQYVAFLKYRSRIGASQKFDEDQLAALYAEFSEEDRELAETGMSDYADALAKEDAWL